MKRSYMTLIVGTLACLALCGCGGGGGGSSSGDGATGPKAACDALSGQQVSAASIGLPTHGATVTSVTLVAASPTNSEYCQMNGQIDSVDPAAQPILFEADMPSSWNGKLAQLGGGGWDGKYRRRDADAHAVLAAFCQCPRLRHVRQRWRTYPLRGSPAVPGTAADPSRG